MTLSDSELERYSRHIVLPEVGGAGQRKLKASSVAIVGAGAIGSSVVPALAGAGVGRLTITDDDSVESSNLHRQLIYREDQQGVGKAAAAAAFAKALNSNIETVPVAQRIEAQNAANMLAGHDLVIDGSDSFATRLTVNHACVELAIPLVSASASRFQGQLALLRGWEADQPCYRCFVGDAFDSDDCDTCADLGVLGALSGAVGHLASLMAIRALLGIGNNVTGRLFLLDGLALSWRSIGLPKDGSCKTCGDVDAPTS